jgi:hypothetical protein
VFYAPPHRARHVSFLNDFFAVLPFRVGDLFLPRGHSDFPRVTLSFQVITLYFRVGTLTLATVASPCSNRNEPLQQPWRTPAAAVANPSSNRGEPLQQPWRSPALQIDTARPQQLKLSYDRNS